MLRSDCRGASDVSPSG